MKFVTFGNRLVNLDHVVQMRRYDSTRSSVWLAQAALRGEDPTDRTPWGIAMSLTDEDEVVELYKEKEEWEARWGEISDLVKIKA